MAVWNSVPVTAPDPSAYVAPDEAPATPQQTLEHYFTRAQRGYAVIRRSFLVVGGTRTRVTETMPSRAASTLSAMSLLDKSTSGRNVIPKLLRRDGLERVTSISLGTEVVDVNKFGELAMAGADALTAIGLLD